MLTSKTTQSLISNNLVPMVVEQTGRGERSYDLFSRLLKERIIFLNGEINENLSSLIVGQLIFLEADNAEKDIQIYINSPGGSVTAGLAIYDTMNYIRCNVSTNCVGMAASMGAFLLAAGEKGKRFSLPISEMMIHEPLGGAQGQSSDVEIYARRLIKTREKLNLILSERTGQPLETIAKDTDRDNFMDPDEAKAYGLIDEIIVSR